MEIISMETIWTNHIPKRPMTMQKCPIKTSSNSFFGRGTGGTAGVDIGQT